MLDQTGQTVDGVRGDGQNPSGQQSLPGQVNCRGEQAAAQSPHFTTHLQLYQVPREGSLLCQENITK